MKIELKAIKISELVNGYKDDNENGVVGFGGTLDIRPPYQREFVYKDEQKKLVIDSILDGFPLNSMYWCVKEDGGFEVLDGQQRTISICQYVSGDFSFNDKYFHNLSKEQQQKILDYELQVYFCEGTAEEKLKWFKRINTAGVQLTEQELRNAVYSGPFVTEAKQHFSKTGCPAYQKASDYINGSPIRQDYLETALEWIADKEGTTIEDYMAKHQHDTNCRELWLYFTNVINWIEATFTNKRTKLMKGIKWGKLYNKHYNDKLDPVQIEAAIARLIKDDDVTNQKGIYAYILSGDEKHLSIRAFTDAMKQTAYEKQDGICPICGKRHNLSDMQGDHITPWSKGGKTIAENCQMLCKDCNRRKSNV